MVGMSLSELVNIVVDAGLHGLSLFSVLLLMALGLAIIFGQMGVINMAHGEFMTIGAYTTYRRLAADRAAMRPALIGRTTSCSRSCVAFVIAFGARAGWSNGC